MSKSTALGYDLIDLAGIIDCKDLLLKQIKHPVNTSLLSGKFANKWKFAKLSPRLKSKDLDPTSVSEYRPVAILPAISKVVKRAAQLQLIGFLEKTRQLHPSCHAYRKHFSTMTTLMEIMDEIHQSAENKCMTSLMMLDQTAAFDTVSHCLLVEKLAKYNVGPDARH